MKSKVVFTMKDGTTKEFDEEKFTDFHIEQFRSGSCERISCHTCPFGERGYGIGCQVGQIGDIQKVERIIEKEEQTFEVGDKVYFREQGKIYKYQNSQVIVVECQGEKLLINRDDVELINPKKAQKEMTFERIQKEGIKFLVDEFGVKRKVVGFEDGYIITWTSRVKHCSRRMESEIKNWKVAE